jgi:hypothetical protein
MWNIIAPCRDNALIHASGDRWQNASVDDFMAYQLGECIPGPDGLSRGWRIWPDHDGKRLLCERKGEARSFHDMLSMARVFNARRERRTARS